MRKAAQFKARPVPDYHALNAASVRAARVDEHAPPNAGLSRQPPRRRTLTPPRAAPRSLPRSTRPTDRRTDRPTDRSTGPTDRPTSCLHSIALSALLSLLPSTTSPAPRPPRAR